MSMIDAYFGSLAETLERVMGTQKEAMEEAARRIACAMRGGHMAYAFGSGHGHLLALELFYRAGGPACVCPILDERLMLHLSASESTQWERKEALADELLERYPVSAGDVLIITSNSGRNGVPVRMAQLARTRGACVIALTNLRHSRASSSRCSSGLRLFETADVVIDNGGAVGDASMRAADGMMTGPTSTAVGAAILQAVFCRVKEISLEEGWEAEFFKSSNLDGGDAYNEKLLAKYAGRIPSLV
ncbi:MAG: SIS domain-containing protein [Clostridia bacterium]|nr:SIS domain-containing protein [Clostridia bacterium]